MTTYKNKPKRNIEEVLTGTADAEESGWDCTCDKCSNVRL